MSVQGGQRAEAQLISFSRQSRTAVSSSSRTSTTSFLKTSVTSRFALASSRASPRTRRFTCALPSFSLFHSGVTRPERFALTHAACSHPTQELTETGLPLGKIDSQPDKDGRQISFAGKSFTSREWHTGTHGA